MTVIRAHALAEGGRIDEWRVTGMRRGHPDYQFVYRSDDIRWPGDQAEHAARRFVRLAQQQCWSPPWIEGPHLDHAVSQTARGPWERIQP